MRVILISILSLALLFGCVSDDRSMAANGDNSGTSAMTDGSWKVVLVSYNNGTDVPQKALERTDYTYTIYSNGKDYRFDFKGTDEEEGQRKPFEYRDFNISSKTIHCSIPDGSNNFECQDENSPTYMYTFYVYFMAEDFKTNPAAYDVLDTWNQTFAGAAATCSRVIGKSSADPAMKAYIVGNYTMCLSEDGAPVYVQLGKPGLSSNEIVAVEYTANEANAFELPSPINSGR